MLGADKSVIVTELTEGEHIPFDILHWKTYTPGIMPVTLVLFKEALVITGIFGPLIIVHVPVPMRGTFAASEVLVTLQRFCAGPAFDIVGEDEFVTVTVLVEGVHASLDMLH